MELEWVIEDEDGTSPLGYPTAVPITVVLDIDPGELATQRDSDGAGCPAVPASAAIKDLLPVNWFGGGDFAALMTKWALQLILTTPKLRTAIENAALAAYLDK